VNFLAASSGIAHTVGSIFQPIFKAFGWLLAFFYQLVPNYVFAITMLTIVVMGILTPFTVKSTRSMMAMQRIQPELKKLQQKYKGPENRQLLNEEMMKLYREEGVNPLGGCVPVLIQAPFLAILYGVIKGLSNVNPVTHAAEPRYIPHSSAMYTNLVASGGKIEAFGINLALKPFSPHGSWVNALPYFILVAIAVGLQYFQMWQMNNRNRKTGQAIPSQALMLQRIMPIAFAYFYIVIPAAVVLYMIDSTIIRIITQDVMFRTGVSNPHKQKERRLPSRAADDPDAMDDVMDDKPSTNGKGPAALPAPDKKPPPHPRSKAKKPRKDR